MKQTAPYDWDQIKLNNDFIWWCVSKMNEDFPFQVSYLCPVNDSTIAVVKYQSEQYPEDFLMYTCAKDNSSTFQFVRTYQTDKLDLPVLWICTAGEISTSEVVQCRSLDMYYDLTQGLFRKITDGSTIDPGREFELMSSTDDANYYLKYE